jgi:hypothetical protein
LTHSFPSRVPKGTGRFLMRRPADSVIVIYLVVQKKRKSGWIPVLFLTAATGAGQDRSAAMGGRRPGSTIIILAEFGCERGGRPPAPETGCFELVHLRPAGPQYGWRRGLSLQKNAGRRSIWEEPQDMVAAMAGGERSISQP